jgi:hypothetical protein
LIERTLDMNKGFFIFSKRSAASWSMSSHSLLQVSAVLLSGMSKMFLACFDDPLYIPIKFFQ